MPPRLAVLRGRDHTEFETYAVVEVGSTLAVATTPGAARSGGPRSSNPNEDAGAVLGGSAASALVVADGHFGLEAAETVVDFVTEALGEDPPDANLSEDELVRLFFDAGVAVQRGATRMNSVHPDARTTMAIALITHETIQWAAIGDSCVVVVGGDGSFRLDTPRAAFLGDRFTLADIASALTRGQVARKDVSCVVCATDGLALGISEAGLILTEVIAADAAAADSAADLAERLVTRALSDGVDDAVTVAVALS
jgi:serine/threonine protein phosphatase PrpC